MPQVVIYPAQAATLLGHSYEASKKLLGRVRVRFQKPARSYVSIREFCEYTGLTEQDVTAALR